VHALVRLDELLFLALNGAGSRALDPVFKAITYGGHAVVLALLVFGPMARFDRPRLRLHWLPLVLSVALGSLGVEGAKWAVYRDRPARHFAAASHSPPVRVRMPAVQLYDRSFPSGHAQAAFGTATYASLLYPPVTVLAFTLATLVGLSRIYLGVHFPLDVIAGATTGALFSLGGFKLAARRQRRRSSGNTSAPACQPRSSPPTRTST